jgi:hypothetical protein
MGNLILNDSYFSDPDAQIEDSFGTSIRSLITMFVVMQAIAPFFNFAQLLIIVMLIYASVGVLLFHDVFVLVLLPDDRPSGNFDTFANAMLTLFQLLIGEGWDDLMCWLL